MHSTTHLWDGSRRYMNTTNTLVATLAHSTEHVHDSCIRTVVIGYTELKVIALVKKRARCAAIRVGRRKSGCQCRNDARRTYPPLCSMLLRIVFRMR